MEEIIKTRQIHQRKRSLTMAAWDHRINLWSATPPATPLVQPPVSLSCWTSRWVDQLLKTLGVAPQLWKLTRANDVYLGSGIVEWKYLWSIVWLVSSRICTSLSWISPRVFNTTMEEVSIQGCWPQSTAILGIDLRLQNWNLRQLVRGLQPVPPTYRLLPSVEFSVHIS